MPRMLRSNAQQEQVQAQGREYLEGLARGLRVVEAMGHNRSAMTLSELAKLVAMPRASVRRVLLTLEHLGFVASDGRGFRLTPKILGLARAYLSSSSMAAIVQPIVEAVAADTGESCAAAVLDVHDVVFVASAIPSRVITVRTDVGLRLPAHCTSVGRAILSGLSRMELDEFLARMVPVKKTDATVVDHASLRAAILKAKADGYSIVDQEGEIGLRSVAVPVRRQNGAVVCALNVAVRSERVGIARLRNELLSALRLAAAEVEAALL